MTAADVAPTVHRSCKEGRGRMEISCPTDRMQRNDQPCCLVLYFRKIKQKRHPAPRTAQFRIVPSLSSCFYNLPRPPILPVRLIKNQRNIRSNFLLIKRSLQLSLGLIEASV